MKQKLSLLFCLTLLTVAIAAQDEKQKPRVFISDSKSWEMAGGFAGNKEAASGNFSGGAVKDSCEALLKDWRVNKSK